MRELCRLLAPTPTAVIHHDAYYRDLSHVGFEERVGVNFDHPDALETDLMVEHVRQLVDGQRVELPTYDFATHTRKAEQELRRPTPVIVIDGILVLADARLRSLLDLGVFVDTDADVRLIRRIRRDMRKRGRSAASVIEQYETTVRPMHLQFVEPSKRHADLVVPEGGYNRVAVDLVVSRVQALLAEQKARPSAG